MMRSFSYNVCSSIDGGLYYTLWNEIEKLRRYFGRFCGDSTDEAMQATLMHALTHYTETKGEIDAYIKALARDITRDNGKLVYVDFLEQTVSKDGDLNNVSRIDTGKVNDFSKSVINNIMISSSKRKEVIELALCFMDKFMLMCEALINKDTTSNYYPDIYIAECMKLSSGCENFNQICISVYSDFRDKFTEFFNYNTKTVGVWRESDFPLIRNSKSKRLKLINPKTNLLVDDPDIEPFTTWGNLGDKRILKVRYLDIWEVMCDYVDAPSINVMRFTADDSYIIRTLGGSISVVNPDLYNIYDLCRQEILSNVLHDLNARYVGVGSECFYLVINADGKQTIPERVVKGIPIKLTVEDITNFIN